MVHPSSVLPVNAVIKPAFAVAVCVDHMLRAVFLRHIRKTATFFQDIRRRVMKEHDVFPVSGVFCQFKGFPKPLQLALHQFFRLLVEGLAGTQNPADSFLGCIELLSRFATTKIRSNP